MDLFWWGSLASIVGAIVTIFLAMPAISRWLAHRRSSVGRQGQSASNRSVASPRGRAGGSTVADAQTSDANRSVRVAQSVDSANADRVLVQAWVDSVRSRRTGEEAKIAAIRELEKLGMADPVEVALDDMWYEVRMAAVRALGRMGAERGLTKALGNEYYEVRLHVVRQLA